MKIGRIGLTVVGGLLLAACGSTSGGTGGGPHPTPTADLAAAAATAYSAAFNVMNTSETLDIPKQNLVSTDPTGAAAAINDRASVRLTFDAAVQAITFPDADKSDAHAVLNSDASLEAALGTLAANTDSIPNYNSIFSTALAAETAFTGADAALSRDLGLK